MRPFFLLAFMLLLTRGMGQTIWSNYFNAAPDWVIEHDGVVSLDWQIGVGLDNTGPLLIDPIQSSTAGTGFAMLDSDGFDNQTTDEELAHMTTALPIDLSATANVGLTFQTNYRASSAGRCYVVVSTDGTFPLLTSTTDISGLPNVFELFANMPDGAYSTNPQLVQLNISAVAAGQPTVWIRFMWAGIHGYAWFIDDVKLIELPEVDLELRSVHISNSAFVPLVGATPLAQLGPEMLIGGTVENNGSLTQTDILISASVTGPLSFGETVSITSLSYGDSATSISVFGAPPIDPGLYEATFSTAWITSVTDVNPGNNEAVRQFSITENTYALDGIGVVPSGDLVLGSLGTTTFANCEDGITLFSYMQVNVATEVISMHALLASGTQAGGFVVFGVYDTTEVLDFNGSIALFTSDVVPVTPTTIAAGRIEVIMEPGTMLPPGGYYLGVTLYSSLGSFNIIVKDDLTYPQPAIASLFYHPGDATVYSNGNALAVRAQLGGAPPCHAEYIASQATDGNGDPIPFVVNIVNTSTSLSSGFSWLWDFGDGEYSTEEFPSHDYMTNGPYTLCLSISDALGCTDQYCDDISVDDSGLFTRSQGFTIHVVPATGIGMEEHATTTMLTIQPNPVIDMFRLTGSWNSPQQIVRITDALGRTVLEQRIGDGTIDVSAFTPGPYVLRTENGHVRFVKQ